MKKILLSCLFIASCSTINTDKTALIGDRVQDKSAQKNSQLLQQVIDGKHRSLDNKSRDQYRHPQETLRFFEVEPDMTVVELWPGGKGWYTEILAPYLKDDGKLYASHFSSYSKTPYFVKNLKKFKEKTLAHPELYQEMVLTVLQPPQFLQIAPEGSADRVLTFRNFHNWMKSGQIEAVLSAAYKALKPGGLLGVVEHRGLPGKDQDPKALSGYVKESYVIALAEKAGFELAAKSEINANPKDTTQYPKGVWTLPPSLKLKDQEKTKYLSIGESDRMTLKFLKAKINK